MWHRNQDVIGNVVAEGVEVSLEFDRRVSEDRFWFGSPDQFAVEHAVIQRLFAKAVSGDDQAFAAHIHSEKAYIPFLYDR